MYHAAYCGVYVLVYVQSSPCAALGYLGGPCGIIIDGGGIIIDGAVNRRKNCNMILHYAVSVAGMLWHGTDRGTRRFMARPGTENLGTARHGKSWHGNIMARHGTKNHARWTRFTSNSMIFEQIQILEIIYIYMNFQISGKLVLIRPETIFPKVVRLEK